MRKTDNIIRYSLAAAFIFLLFSCSKDEYNTPHPDKGVIAVNINHPQGAEERKRMITPWKWTGNRWTRATTPPIP